MIQREAEPSHRQKAWYSMTNKASELLPVCSHIGAWGTRHLPGNEERSIRAKLLAEGGPSLWKAFMAELQEEHLGIPLPAGARHGGPTVRERLQAAYEEVRAGLRSEEHTSELQSLMRSSYAVFCLKKQNKRKS